MFEVWARSGFAWSLVDIYWVDERCVPIDDPQSNYKLANAVWLEPAHVPTENIHRVLTELDPQDRPGKHQIMAKTRLLTQKFECFQQARIIFMRLDG